MSGPAPGLWAKALLLPILLLQPGLDITGSWHGVPGHGVMDLPPQHRPAGARSHHAEGLGRSFGLCGALEGVVRGASSFLLPQLHQEQPLRDVSPKGMLECGSSGELWMSGPRGLLGWSFEEKERERAERKRGGEEKMGV